MSVHVSTLRTDARESPLGVDTTHPAFSWHLTTELTGVLQTGYQLQVATTPDFGDPTVWDSGVVEGDAPFGARYDGPALLSMRRYWWRIRAHCLTGAVPGHPDTGDPVVTGWSPSAWFEPAALDPEVWQARWIGGPPPASKTDDPVLYLRTVAVVDDHIVRARAYVSALGWYRLFVNGRDQTGEAQVPRWTPVSEIVEYQTYDVTSELRGGPNVIAIAVGDGRYRGSLGLPRSRAVYGDRIGAFAQLHLEYADGTVRILTTDDDWHAGPGRITGSDPMLGERTDLRIPDRDWLTELTPPQRFSAAQVLPDQHHRLVAEEVARVAPIDRLPATIHRAPSGAQLLDFGQNFSGVVRIRLSGAAGTTVQLTHAELLGTDGELDTRSFVLGKQWYQRDVVILDGDTDWYQPWFTVHGFRYVEVTGLPADLDPADVVGVVLSSDLPPAGTFACSDDRLNRLYRNVVWSVRSNFLDTPTDCPTRERAGWTGDIQVFAPTAAVLVDAQAYLDRYLRNLVVEQFDDGVVPIYVPSQAPIRPSLGRRMTHFMSQSVGWSDAAVLLPWTVYRYYGDRGVLERNYDSMRLRVDGMERRARRKGRHRHLLNSGFHFGEWLRPGENGPRTILRHIFKPPTDIATAYFAHVADVLSRAAAVLGRDTDAARYRDLHARIAQQWRASFVHPDGRLAQDRQDDYVRALAFDLLTPQQRPAAADRLAELVTAAGNHLDTGFLSTPMILSVLTEAGRPDIALALLFQTTNPSWLFQVHRGATTVWETWEGYDEAGNGKESHNHYALGTVAGWLVQGLGGLSPATAGYRCLRIAPVIAPELEWVRTTLTTPFGQAGAEWRRTADGGVDLQVTVPAGATAAVSDEWTTAHGGRGGALGSGRHLLRRAPR